jgi:hypothetical protein
MGSGMYTTDSPVFGWNVGFPNNLTLDNVTYRITIRAPSNNYVPSREIYFQVTGYQNTANSYTFDFADNASAVSNQGLAGPFRNYDIVVEAVDNLGNSSAGGNYIFNANHDSSYNNAFGYDIFYATNPQTPAINLYTGAISSPFYQTGFATQQSINGDGDVRIYFTISGQTVNPQTFFNDAGLAGVTLYWCGIPFVAEEAQQLIPLNPPTKAIYSTQYTNNVNPVIIPANLAGSGIQYIAIAGYDNFDVSINNNYPTYLTTGLNISNIVQISNTSTPSAAYYSAWILLEVDGHTILSNWQTNSFNIAGVQSVDGLILITFASQLPSNIYTVEMSSYPYISQASFQGSPYLIGTSAYLCSYNQNNLTIGPALSTWENPSLQGHSAGTSRCFIGILTPGI